MRGRLHLYHDASFGARTRALVGTGAAALIAGLFFDSGPAIAACTLTSGTGTASAPNPNSAVSCTGTTVQAGGVVIGQGPGNNISVILQPNAIVESTAAPPITLGNSATILVDTNASLLGRTFAIQQALATGINANVTIAGITQGIIDLGSGSTVVVSGAATNNSTQPAIRFGGDGNRLTLIPGYSITGDVISGDVGATQTILELAGTGSATFSASAIGPAAQYQNFAQFQKTGASIWTLTGTTTSLTPWAISGGTLSIASDAALGASSGGLTLDGAQLQITASTSSSRAITLNAGGGTLNLTAGTVLTENGVIGGTGALTVGTFSSNGTVVLNSASTYSGGTIIDSGTLQLGAGGQLPSGGSLNLASLGSFHGVLDLNGQNQTLGALSGNGDILLNGGTLTISTASSSTYTGTIQGTGALVFNGPGALVLGGGAYFMTAPIVVNGGSLSIIGPGSLVGGNDLTINGGTFSVTRNADLGTLSGTGGTLAMGNLSQITVTSSSNSTFGGVITGFSPASFIKAGTGTLTLTGNSSFAGPIVISGGALQIGNSGTSGSLAGNITDNAALIFNRSDAVTYNGVISGTGSVTKTGAGALTLAGINTYTGNTTVSTGALNVTGAIAASTVSVSSGASLSGTGKVGSTTIASGGTLNPGSSTTPGTLSVAGNLTLASGSNYADAITPAAAGLTSVSGIASINGNFIASVAPGTYTFGQRFTVLTAGGGLSGTFATLSGIPAFVTGQLSYDANNAYLTFRPIALTPFLSNATGNQHSVVTAIDAAVLAGAPPSGGFLNLYGLSGSALNNALDQISGQVGPNVTNAVGNSFLSFISMAAQGGSGSAGNFAPGSAYRGADAPHRAQLGAGETRLWGAAYGGHAGLSGDSISGAAGLSSNNAGLIGGADMQVGDGLIAGVTLGVGRQWFRSGNGRGDSDDFMIGLYGRADIDAAYIAASFGYGWHQVTTVRTITVSGTDMLQGKQDPNDFGGRIEAGWHLPLDNTYTVTPYGAFAGESFESPAYAETAIFGASTFALSYGAQTTALGRSELGAHLDRDYALDTGTLTADLRAAWAHQLDDQPFIQASFQGLAGSAFQVAGVHPARDTALLGVDLEVQNSSGLFFGVHGEGQFGAGTTLVEGLGNFGWRW